MLDSIRSNAIEIDGVLVYPHAYGEYAGVMGSAQPVPREEAGWYDYAPTPYAQGMQMLLCPPVSLAL